MNISRIHAPKFISGEKKWLSKEKNTEKLQRKEKLFEENPLRNAKNVKHADGCREAAAAALR